MYCCSTYCVDLELRLAIALATAHYHNHVHITQAILSRTLNTQAWGSFKLTSSVLSCTLRWLVSSYLATLSRVLQMISFTWGTSSSRIPCSPTENEASRVLLSYLRMCAMLTLNCIKYCVSDGIPGAYEWRSSIQLHTKWVIKIPWDLWPYLEHEAAGA